jgi:hypothetical protein
MKLSAHRALHIDERQQWLVSSGCSDVAVEKLSVCQEARAHVHALCARLVCRAYNELISLHEEVHQGRLALFQEQNNVRWDAHV